MNRHEQRDKEIRARRTKISIMFVLIWAATVLPTCYAGAFILEGDLGRLVATLGSMTVSMIASLAWGKFWLEAEE